MVCVVLVYIILNLEEYIILNLDSYAFTFFYFSLSRITEMTKKLFFVTPGRVTHLTPFSHAESDVYLVTLGGAGLILHADEQALRLRASNAKRYTAVKDLNSPLPTVALCPSLEYCLAQRIKSPLRQADLHFSCRAYVVHR